MAECKERVIVALDRDTSDQNDALVDELGDRISWYKVGSALFCRRGPDAVTALVQAGKRVFLDLKFHDIPNTVALSVAAACKMGASLLTVHGVGGSEMLRAAAEASRAHGSERTKVLAVTVLTSQGGGSVSDRVRTIAEQAHEANCDGIICSPLEAERVRSDRGNDFIIVTPGIRVAKTEDDQKRVATPSSAIAGGADLLVIGRPIYKAADPLSALQRIEADLEG